MTHTNTFQEVKTYTQRLLAIKGFKNYKERVTHKQKLAQIRVKLVKLSHHFQDQKSTTSPYASGDFEKIVEKMETAQLMRDINARMLRLSV